MRRRDFLRALGLAAMAPSAARAEAPAGTAPAPTSAANPFGLPGVGRRPNIILVLCDDLGWGDLGCFWQNRRQAKNRLLTPNLDRMAAEGLMLTDHCSAAPVCAPARASLVTGKNQGHCNLRDNAFDAAIDPHMTLATVLKQAGYATWHIGKWGVGGGYQSGTRRTAMACQAGFDYSYGYPAHLHGHSYYHCFLEGQTDIDSATSHSPVLESYAEAAYQAAGRPEGFARDQEPGAKTAQWRRPAPNEEARFVYDADLFTAKAKALIRAHQEGPAKDAPFFLLLCQTAVHGSGNRQVADPAIACKDVFQVPGGPYPALRDDDPTWGGGADLEGAVKATPQTANTWIHPDFRAYPTDSERRYATTVRRLDDAMGDLLHFLKVRGLDRDTLVVFTSDNGPAGEYLRPAGLKWVETMDSNGPFRGMKRWAYQGGLREPTLVRWPGVVAPGAVSALPCDQTCWMPTFAEAAGLPAPAHADGVSLLPTLAGAGRQLPQRLYAEYVDGGSGQGFGLEQTLREGRWAAVRNHAKGAKTELYDLDADPGQTRDVAADFPDVAARLGALLLASRIPTPRVPDACGAPTHAQTDAPARAALDRAAVPAPSGGAPTRPALWIYQGDWPWVPDFRTLMPVHEVPAARIGAVMRKLPPRGCGVLAHGEIEVEAEREVVFEAKGAGGCQFWLQGAHILEFEAGDCAAGRRYAIRLGKGRHPWRACLTAPFVTLTADGEALL